MDAINELREYIDEYAINLPSRTWIYETDRWENLIFSVIRQFCAADAEKAQAAVTILRDWSLLDIENLTTEDQIPLQHNSAFTEIFTGLDFSPEDIHELAKILENISQAVQKKYDGKLQSVFRKYGEMIRDELVEAFSEGVADKLKINNGISLWLQSAYGLPVPSERSAVLAYCEKKGISPQKLWDLADELDLNLGVVDFFIEMGQSPRQELLRGKRTESGSNFLSE